MIRSDAPNEHDDTTLQAEKDGSTMGSKGPRTQAARAIVAAHRAMTRMTDDEGFDPKRTVLRNPDEWSSFVTDLVPATEIEQIVGARRHALAHLGRFATAEQTVYILHSQACLNSGIDLRSCIYSRALERGIEELPEWEGWKDRAVTLQVESDLLLPDPDGPPDVVLAPTFPPGGHAATESGVDLHLRSDAATPSIPPESS